jgi:hypothetical protein
LLVAAIVVGAGLGALLDPRIGLAVALAAPIFPLGNHAESAAVLYGALALGWLLICWRDARSGLLFVSGILLAPLGLLSLVPLVVQPARGLLRRGAQAALAVLAAALATGVSRDDLRNGGTSSTLEIAPHDSVGEVATAVWDVLALHPVVLAGAAVAATSAAILPWARRRSRYGVAAVGAGLVWYAVATGTGVAAVVAVTLAWALAAIVAAGTRR